MKVREFIKTHFRHFNAASLHEAAQEYVKQIEKGNKMLVSLAGAMSTAELGLSLAEMIRKDKVHIISCTGANLEEDLFNLVGHEHYKRIPHYRDLTPKQEEDLAKKGLNRVTDTCIPEDEAMRVLEKIVTTVWKEADQNNERFFPHEYFYKIIRNGNLKPFHQIDPKNSWLIAASEKSLPIYVPGWEDSTIGNMFAACVKKKVVSGYHIVKSGPEYMGHLVDTYLEITSKNELGFFQIGGGIAGDFPICVVPLIEQDMKKKAKLWAYFCQVSDSTTSFGSYSGAIPNEKITWGKLGANTPKFIIESDATIVAPLLFGYVLDW